MLNLLRGDSILILLKPVGPDVYLDLWHSKLSLVDLEKLLVWDYTQLSVIQLLLSVIYVRVGIA